MADDRFYLGPGDWNDNANWSVESGGAGGASFPTITENAIFDDNSGNCTLDAAAAALSISVPNYTGTLDAATFDVDIGSGGLDCTDGGGAALDLGSGTWTCGGDFDYEDVGSFTRGTSKLVMTGGAATIKGADSTVNTLYDLTINALAVVTGEEHVYVYNDIKISGTLDMNANKTLTVVYDIYIYEGGTLSGDAGSVLYVPGAIAGIGFKTMAGTCSIDVIKLRNSQSGFLLPAAVYDSQLWLLPLSAGYSLKLTGSHTFNSLLLEIYSSYDSGDPFTLDGSEITTLTVLGDVQFHLDGEATLVVDNSGGAADWNIGGDVYADGTAASPSWTWTKGTGTITLDGSGNQSIDFNDQAIEALVIANTGGEVTFSGGCTGTSFNAQTGDFDPNGQTLETTGAFTIAAGVNLISAAQGTALWDGVALTVGGTFAVQGNPGDDCNLQGDGGWTLDAAAAGTVNNVTVSGCDADAGVDITARNSLDGSGNSSWIFPEVSGSDMLLGLI